MLVSYVIHTACVQYCIHDALRIKVKDEITV